MVHRVRRADGRGSYDDGTGERWPLRSDAAPKEAEFSSVHGGCTGQSAPQADNHRLPRRRFSPEKSIGTGSFKTAYRIGTSRFPIVHAPRTRRRERAATSMRADLRPLHSSYRFDIREEAT